MLLCKLSIVLCEITQQQLRLNCISSEEQNSHLAYMPVGAKWSWSRYSSLTTVRIRSCPVATAHCLVSSCELSLLEHHDCLAQVSSESSRHHTRHDAKTSRLRPISQFAVHESRVYVDSTSSANHRKTHALDDLNYSMLVPGGVTGTSYAASL
jgi:hypothetical protein